MVSVTSADHGPIPAGRRNDTLTRYAGLLRRCGANQEEILSALHVRNLAVCEPPLPETELVSIAASIARYDTRVSAEEFRIEDIHSIDFATATYTIDYHAKGLVAKHNSMVIGGASKTMKTSISMDIGAAVSSGTAALNHFPTKKARVGIISGESGAAVLQDGFRRIREARNLAAGDCDIWWAFQIPQLMNPAHLTALRRWVEHRGIEMLIVDPIYLMLLDATNANSAGNVFAMGTALRGFASLAADTGVTPAMNHHTTKNAARMSLERSEPLSLEDLSQAGFAEFARQWLLVSRRSKWNGTGDHFMWANYGGSAGHGGICGLDIREGQITDIGGRRWSVTVRDREEVEQEKSDRADNSTLDKRERDMERHRGTVIEFIRKKGVVTKNDMRDCKGVRKGVAEDVFTELRDSGDLVETTVSRGNGRKYQAFTLPPGPTRSDAVPDRLEHTTGPAMYIADRVCASPADLFQ